MKRMVLLAVLILGLVAPIAQAQPSAMQGYQRIWKQDRSYFGAKGMPAPRVQFIPRGEGYLVTGSMGSPIYGPQIPGAPKVIRIGYVVRRQLRSAKAVIRRAVRFPIEHEFGRIFEYLPGASSSEGAGLANSVANGLARFRNTGRDNPTAFLRTHLPYWGQNPRTILWPTH